MKRKQTKMHRLTPGDVFSFQADPDYRLVIDGVENTGKRWMFRYTDDKGDVFRMPYDRAQQTNVFKWVKV